MLSRRMDSAVGMADLTSQTLENPMYEIGDTVRKRDSQEIRTVTGIGPGEFYMTQVGTDAATIKPIRGSDLELVAKKPKPQTEPSFIPTRSIMDDGF